MKKKKKIREFGYLYPWLSFLPWLSLPLSLSRSLCFLFLQFCYLFSIFPTEVSKMNYEAVTHYTLASNPRNRSIIDVTNKRTGELSFMKLRHKLQSCYAISLVDPSKYNAVYLLCGRA